MDNASELFNKKNSFLHTLFFGTYRNHPENCGKYQKKLMNSARNLDLYLSVWGLSLGKVSYEAHIFSLFSTMQEKTLPVEKLRGYTIAVIIAHASWVWISGRVRVCICSSTLSKCWKLELLLLASAVLSLRRRLRQRMLPMGPKLPEAALEQLVK